MSLRLRLTLWYSTVLAVVIGLFGMGVYSLVIVSLTGQIDLSLRDAAGEIIRNSSINPRLSVVTLPPNLDQFGGPNVYAQIWRADGTLVHQSATLNVFSEALDPDSLEDSQPQLRNVLAHGVHLRVYTAPMRTLDGRLVGYVQTAASLRVVDTARSRMLVILLAGGVLAVVLAALIGWASAERALQPLKVITRTAQQITRADDLSRRIPLSGPAGDEVGHLTTTFNESLERLERLFKTQQRFLADVSHELRTPLTTIRGNVDLMRRMGEADATSLDAIQLEAERMTRLVGDLLLLAQADVGTLPLVKSAVDLDTLLLEVAREAQIQSSGVQVNVGEIDQVKLIGDRDRLKQLLLNLTSNALKHTPAGGRVTVGLARVGDWVRLTVSDTGQGIPPEELTKIFERFYRVDKARSRALGGAGLGLSIAQRIAHMHGGRIEAASEGVPGRGSTFTVWLPLTEEKPAAAPAPAQRAARGREAGSRPD